MTPGLATSLRAESQEEKATLWPLVAVLGASLLWRVPSFFDPPWVNDEGTYFAVARALAHGATLYVGIWENKPPALYLVYDAVYQLFGASLLAIRLVAGLATLLTVALTYAICRASTSPAPALAGALLCGLLLGVPFLEGTTANAEIFFIPFTALAVLLAVPGKAPGGDANGRGPSRAALAGLAAGVAVLFKAVAGFDAAAVAIWLVVHRRSSFVPYLAGFAVVVIATAVSAWRAGFLPAMLRDAVLYDLGYIGQTNGSGAPWGLLLKLGVLTAVTLALRRAPFPYLWLVYTVTGASISGRIFGHYAVQVIPPAAVCLALVLRDRPPVARRTLVILPGLFVGLGAVSALAGWTLAASGHDSILARRLQYYVNFVRLASGSESYASYRSQIDDHVTRNIEIARLVERSPPGRLLVWGNTPWIYVLSDRAPATRYTSALRDPEVPGETEALRAALDRATAREVVVITPPMPPLGNAEIALGRAYRSVAAVDNAELYVSTPSNRRRRSANTTARASSGTR